MPRASLLAIGNELLNGKVRDKNLYTLSQALTNLGVIVEYAAIARDVPEASAAFLHLFVTHPVSDKPPNHLKLTRVDVLIISGGLGPTQDDLTLSALARALGLPLDNNTEARALVEEQYASLLKQRYLTRPGPEAARHKMSRLPRGAQPLPNPVGTAPGVRLDYQGTLIYCLPGVPSELEAIFNTAIEPDLRQRFALETRAEVSLIAFCDDEASVAAPLRDVTARHPDVYFKSLARPFPAAHNEGLHIIIAAQNPDAAQAHKAVERARADLQQTLTTSGIVTQLEASEDRERV